MPDTLARLPEPTEPEQHPDGDNQLMIDLCKEALYQRAHVCGAIPRGWPLLMDRTGNRTHGEVHTGTATTGANCQQDYPPPEPPALGVHPHLMGKLPGYSYLRSYRDS